jgi:hypothetical protein
MWGAHHRDIGINATARRMPVTFSPDLAGGPRQLAALRSGPMVVKMP